MNFDTFSEPLPRRLAAGLTRLAAVARQLDWRTAESEGLTPTQGDILGFACARPAGVRLAAAAAQVGVSNPTASDAVAALARKGLIERRPDAADGRAVAIVATAAGRTLNARRPASFETVIAGLDPVEQETLLRLTAKMIRSLQRAGAIAPQRTCVTCRFFRENVAPGSREPHYCAFVGAPMGDRHLRIDCPEHQPSP
ncbi:MAG: MarR family winged helix-turn-helix transcriptional regulator [Rhodospirillales bacterium]|jgi:DNA-binding MarR family transcriptional regulator|nr:MarR family winged helix-turn-helix transcriptional regulator [Rhodospirillales bacterium]